MHFPEGGKMQLSPKLELCRANQDQIRNQRPQLRRNRLFLQFIGTFFVQIIFYKNIDCDKLAVDVNEF